MIPLNVMLSEAFKTMPVGYQRVVWILAAQYTGANNGNLALTRKMGRHFGLNNERHRCDGLRMAEERGLIVKTRQGGIANGSKFPTLWALTWHATQHIHGEPLGVVRLPSNRWGDWKQKIHDMHVASSHDTHVASENAIYDTHVASSEAHL